MSNYVPSSVWVNNMNPMKEIFIPKVYKKLAPEIRFIEIQNYIFNIGNVSGIEISKHFDIKINVVRADLKKLMDELRGFKKEILNRTIFKSKFFVHS